MRPPRRAIDPEPRPKTGPLQYGSDCMIRSIVKLAVDERKREEVLSLLRALVGPTQSIPGCLDCCLYKEVQDGGLCFTSEWRSETDLKWFVRSEFFRSLLIAMDLATEEPTVRFDTISRTQGMEYIGRVRRPRGGGQGD